MDLGMWKCRSWYVWVCTISSTARQEKDFSLSECERPPAASDGPADGLRFYFHEKGAASPKTLNKKITGRVRDPNSTGHMLI